MLALSGPISLKEAQELERELIRQAINVPGCLNRKVTSAGLGHNNRRAWTPEERAEQSEKIRESYRNPEIRERVSAAVLAAYDRDPAFREKVAATSKEHWQDPKYRKTQSEARRKAWTPERRKARSEIMKRKWTAERRKAQSETSRKSYESKRAAIREGMRKYWANDENRRKAAQRMRENNPKHK